MKLVLALALLLGGCASTGPPRSTYLRLVNTSTHVVQVYYVHGYHWTKLMHEWIGIADEKTVRLPPGARDGYGKILLGVEYMDGLLIMSQRRGVAMEPFYADHCTETTVLLTYPAGGIGPAAGSPIQVC